MYITEPWFVARKAKNADAAALRRVFSTPRETKLGGEMHVLFVGRCTRDEIVRSDAPRPSLRGQLVGLVEDEVASGRTMLGEGETMGAIEMIMAEGARGVHLVMLRDFAESPFHEQLFSMKGLLSYATTSFGPGLVAGWQNRDAYPFHIIELPLVGFEQPLWLEQLAEQERAAGQRAGLTGRPGDLALANLQLPGV